jgi:predicted GNAT family acetyltransferase
MILDSGKKFCFLFTDQANPTSNSIYQKIGYEPVCDFHEYTFSPVTKYNRQDMPTGSSR